MANSVENYHQNIKAKNILEYLWQETKNDAKIYLKTDLLLFFLKKYQIDENSLLINYVYSLIPSCWRLKSYTMEKIQSS